uniref:Putative secreted protein n=1 Tax=Ixodes ricinus TaxID=34613 RepID=A0A6B0UIB2_IXORI
MLQISASLCWTCCHALYCVLHPGNPGGGFSQAPFLVRRPQLLSRNFLRKQYSHVGFLLHLFALKCFLPTMVVPWNCSESLNPKLIQRHYLELWRYWSWLLPFLYATFY